MSDTIPDGRERPRLTQAQRSTRTQDRVCRATIEALARVGYEKVSTKLIADLADLSRGAVTHHYPAKSDLLVAAYQHLLRDWEGLWPFDGNFDPGTIPMAELIDVLWRDIFATESYLAALELMLAARIDDQLGRRLRPILAKWADKRDRAIMQALGLAPQDPTSSLLLHLNLCVLRGIAVNRSFDDRADVEAGIIALWKSLVTQQIAAMAER